MKTTTSPAASMPMTLQMMVEVGLVVGVMAPRMPKGAGSIRVRPWSPVQATGEVFDAGGFLDDELVFEDFVFEASEAGFVVGGFGEGSGVFAHDGADALDDRAAFFEGHGGETGRRPWRRRWPRRRC